VLFPSINLDLTELVNNIRRLQTESTRRIKNKKYAVIALGVRQTYIFVECVSNFLSSSRISDSGENLPVRMVFTRHSRVFLRLITNLFLSRTLMFYMSVIKRSLFRSSDIYFQQKAWIVPPAL